MFPNPTPILDILARSCSLPCLVSQQAIGKLRLSDPKPFAYAALAIIFVPLGWYVRDDIFGTVRPVALVRTPVADVDGIRQIYKSEWQTPHGDVQGRSRPITARNAIYTNGR